MIRAMTRTSALRVYLPLTEFTSLDPHVDDAHGALRESAFGLISEPLAEDGLLTDWHGERFMCPRNARLRMLQGVLAFHSAYGDAGGRLIIPENVAHLAAEELDRIYHQRPHLRSHILTSAWHVPPRWFLCFDPDEKEIVDTRRTITVRYRSRRLSATGRLNRALAALRRAGFDEAVFGELEELADWLDGFPEEAMVELDYDTVAEMFPEGELVTDESSEEIWKAVESLEAGDLDGAQDRYMSMAARWSEAMAVGFHS